MGMWGSELYQNDTSLDIKDEFEELFIAGKNVQDITDIMTEEYGGIIGNDDEEALFWFALADTQWNNGVLLPFVKEKAICLIDKEMNGFKNDTTDLSEKTNCEKKLNKLRTKLMSPQPTAEKPVKKRTYKCQWKSGDVFAYRLESDLAKERGLYGRYILIRKVDEAVWYPGHIVPIVYFKITSDTNLSDNVGDYDRSEYIQTWFTKYEDRFLPINMSCPEEDIDKKSKIKYEVDEYGFLPQYRAILLNTSKRIVPQKLVYLGNFEDAAKGVYSPFKKQYCNFFMEAR